MTKWKHFHSEPKLKTFQTNSQTWKRLKWILDHLLKTKRKTLRKKIMHYNDSEAFQNYKLKILAWQNHVQSMAHHAYIVFPMIQTGINEEMHNLREEIMRCFQSGNCWNTKKTPCSWLCSFFGREFVIRTVHRCEKQLFSFLLTAQKDGI